MSKITKDSTAERLAAQGNAMPAGVEQQAAQLATDAMEEWTFGISLFAFADGSALAVRGSTFTVIR